ncbi:MAG TPA: PrsW family intramembrane metalloprotease [Candidatus Wolfebacteria bacterium]|nr:PrsW family intramembrane metalloprotease [Candidatus Wolfebacteria bacterium]
MKNNFLNPVRKDIFSNGIKFIFLIITGLILPLILIPVVKLTGFSEIIEEISKALAVLFLIFRFSTLKQKIKAGILFGFLFGLSESIFYLNNIFQVGDFSIFWQRFLWTVPMHIITVLVILLPAFKNRKMIILGIIGAIIIHLLFNNLIA